MGSNTIYLICSLLLLTLQQPKGLQAKHVQKRGVMDSFNEGIKYAGQMFGVNTAADVANLVAKAFSNAAAATTTTRSGNRNQFDFMQTLFQPQQQQQQQQTQDSAESQQQQQQHQTPYAAADDGVGGGGGGLDANGSPAKEVVGVQFDSTGFVTNVLRMIGFDASKLGALAINALIMIAQAIGNTLMAVTKPKQYVNVTEGGRYQHNNNPYATSNAASDNESDDYQPATASDHQARHLRDTDDADDVHGHAYDNRPLDWFLQRNDLLGRLFTHATDAQLADKLVGVIEQLEMAPHEGACLKMLMCKSSPFIWGMQRSLQARYEQHNRNDTTSERSEEVNGSGGGAGGGVGAGLNAHSLFSDLPSVTEYRQHGSKCEQRYAQHCAKLQLAKRKS